MGVPEVENGVVLSAEQMTGRCAALYGERPMSPPRRSARGDPGAVPRERLQLGRRCLGVETRADSIRLTFSDGTAVDADVVVGADGVHSVVRGAIAPPMPAEYSGMCAFRALVPAADAPFARRPVHTLWLGPDHHLVHYPVSSGRFINVVAFAPADDFTEESWSARQR